MGFADKIKGMFKNGGNFKYLDDLIHSRAKEIILDSDIVLGSREESEYEYGIEIDVDDLVIDGRGHAIDARERAAIFHCTGRGITVKNIILKNGFREGIGGAIYNEGELTVSKSLLVNNKSWNGGAILNDGKLTIIKSELSRNTALEHGGCGGAIENRSDDALNITESTFDENKAKYGGAIFNVNGCKISMEKSIFRGNTAEMNGGAIKNRGSLTLRQSLLSGNGAKYDGGVIMNRKDLKVFDCEISNNASSRDVVHTLDSLQISNSVFRDNKVPYVIYSSSADAVLSIIGGQFTDNDVGQSAIYNYGKSCTIDKVTFENKLSGDTSSDIHNKSCLILIDPKMRNLAKTILNESHIIVKKSSPDLLDRINGDGSVETDIIPTGEKFDFGYLDRKIRENGTNEFIMSQDICFETYEWDYYEGGIELDGDNLVIDGNGHTIDGKGKSRIFTITGNNITLRNIVFKNGSAHNSYDNPMNSHGGAIKINHGIDLTIENCRFMNNGADGDGGAIFNPDGELCISKSLLTHNGAGNLGGAIRNGGKLSIRQSSINENLSDFGGAINNDGHLTIIDATLNENSATSWGGAIMNNGDMSITKSSFSENFAGYGGAIGNFKAQSTISESAFNENEASKSGGAIDNLESRLTVDKSTFAKNLVEEYGGAIKSIGELEVSNSTFDENTANKNGGAISYDDRMEITLKDCIFSGNEPLDHCENKKIDCHYMDRVMHKTLKDPTFNIFAPRH